MVAVYDNITRIKELDELCPGTTVRIHQKIREGEKERIQIYEGLIIAKKGKSGVNMNIRVRRIAVNNIGVERVFPVFSPLIEKIEIVKRAKKVRRAKLNFLRHKKGDAFNFPEVQVRKIIVPQNFVPKLVVAETETNAETV